MSDSSGETGVVQVCRRVCMDHASFTADIRKLLIRLLYYASVTLAAVGSLEMALSSLFLELCGITEQFMFGCA